MRTFLAWIGGIAITLVVVRGAWQLTATRASVPNEREAEAMALRAFVVYQAHVTNVVFVPPWTVSEGNGNWTVTSASGLRAVIDKKTGNSRFEHDGARR